MKRLNILLVALCLWASSPLYSQHLTKAVPGKITTIEKSFTDGVIDGYTLYIPHSYRKLKKDFALIVFLHGGLGVGGAVEKVNEQPLPELLLEIGGMSEAEIKKGEKFLHRERNEHLRDSFIVVVPHLTAGPFRDRQFYNQEGAIRQILQDISDRYRVDESRRYITGLSRGGHGTWGLAAKMEDIFAAAVPIAGGIHGVDNFSSLQNMPIWVAHNSGDNIVSYSGSTKAVDAIQDLSRAQFLNLSSTQIAHTPYLKSKRIFTTFDRDDHDAWTDIYSHVEVYKWLLRQRKE